MKKIVILLLTIWGVTAQAVTISPNKVIVEGKVGTIANLQFKIYGHPENTIIEFVKTTDLRVDADTVLSTFELGKEIQYVMPIDIMLKETKDFYLCAVLKKAKSMRLRTCALVKVIVQ
jgi:hypothetical protein